MHPTTITFTLPPVAFLYAFVGGVCVGLFLVYGAMTGLELLAPSFAIPALTARAKAAARVSVEPPALPAATTQRRALRAVAELPHPALRVFHHRQRAAAALPMPMLAAIAGEVERVLAEKWECAA